MTIQPLSICDIQALTTPTVPITHTPPTNGSAVSTILLATGIVIITGYAIIVTIENNRNKKMLLHAKASIEQE